MRFPKIFILYTYRVKNKNFCSQMTIISKVKRKWLTVKNALKIFNSIIK